MAIDTDEKLLVRELAHRCANDLQLVVSLLELQSHRVESPEARDALRDAANRVAILAEARTYSRDRQQTLESALQQVCAALNSQAEPRSILVTLKFATNTDGLSDAEITNLALSVNELATNAVKHAFSNSHGGRITISVYSAEGRELILCVEDDGRPMPYRPAAGRKGLGLDLVEKLLASIGGTLKIPRDGSKRFEISLPRHAGVLRSDRPVAVAFGEVVRAR